MGGGLSFLSYRQSPLFFLSSVSLAIFFCCLRPFYFMTILKWNILTVWILYAGISLLTEYAVLENYSYWLNMLYWNILTVWFFYAGIFLLTEYCVLKYPYCLNLRWKFPYWLNISLLTEYFVLECPYCLNILRCNYPTDWICHTGELSLLTEYLVLEYPYCLNMLHWNFLFFGFSPGTLGNTKAGVGGIMQHPWFDHKDFSWNSLQRCVRAWSYTRMHTHTHTYVYIYMCFYVCMYIYTFCFDAYMAFEGR